MGLREEDGVLPPGLCCGDREVLHNLRVQKWADGSATLTICDRAVFRSPGWEVDGPKVNRLPPLAVDLAEDKMADAERAGKFLSDGASPPDDVENVRRAVRRAKSKVSGLARANTFSYFVTLTLSPDKVDRYNDKEVLRRLDNWLHNASRRFGLAYVLVPERHKDGAVHFHGFVNDALRVEDSGTIIPAGGGRPRRPRSAAERRRLLDDGGHIVFNLPQWGVGFSTAIRLYGEYSSAVGYVCKYIGKELNGVGLPEKIGGRWYYSGGPLRRPVPVLTDADYTQFVDTFPGWDFTVKATGDRFHVVEVSPDGVIKPPKNKEKGGIDYDGEKADKGKHAGL